MNAFKIVVIVIVGLVLTLALASCVAPLCLFL